MSQSPDNLPLPPPEGSVLPKRPGDGPLQFDSVEHSDDAPSPGATCAVCHKPIAEQYWQVNAAITCGTCKDLVAAQLVGGSRLRRLFRACVFGSLGAAVGAAIYAGIAWLAHLEIGLISILVGILAGGGVRYGSDHRGGWLYQGLALVLTYLAIVSMYVPAVFNEVRGLAHKPAVAESPESNAAANATVTTRGTDAVSADAPTAPIESELQSPPTLEQAPAAIALAAPTTAVAEEGPKLWQKMLAPVVLVVAVFAIASAAPFLQGMSNFMGLIIIAIGLYQAWQMNKKATFSASGPYAIGPGPIGSAAAAPTNG